MYFYVSSKPFNPYRAKMYFYDSSKPFNPYREKMYFYDSSKPFNPYREKCIFMIHQRHSTHTGKNVFLWFIKAIQPIQGKMYFYDSSKTFNPLQATLARDNFMNNFSIVIQIQLVLLTPLQGIISLPKSAHATTAQLLCHVQNFIAIASLQFGWEKNEIVSEMDPLSHIVDSCMHIHMFSPLNDQSNMNFQHICKKYISQHVANAILLEGWLNILHVFNGVFLFRISEFLLVHQIWQVITPAHKQCNVDENHRM